MPAINPYPYANNDPVDFSDPTGSVAIVEYASRVTSVLGAHVRFLGCGLAFLAAGRRRR